MGGLYVILGAWYGQGSYFATHASLSAGAYTDKASEKRYLYMCQVLTGEFTKGERGMVTPPAKDPSKPHDKFDSLVDNINSPKEWIIFSDTQAYPEYMIVFVKDWSKHLEILVNKEVSIVFSWKNTGDKNRWFISQKCILFLFSKVYLKCFRSIITITI